MENESKIQVQAYGRSFTAKKVGSLKDVLNEKALAGIIGACRRRYVTLKTEQDVRLVSKVVYRLIKEWQFSDLLLVYRNPQSKHKTYETMDRIR